MFFRLIISDDSDINTPAVAAAYATKKYSKKANDEIAFEVSLDFFLELSPPAVLANSDTLHALISVTFMAVKLINSLA